LGIFFKNSSGHPASEEIFFSANWHNEIFPPRKMHEREDLDIYMLGYIFIFFRRKAFGSNASYPLPERVRRLTSISHCLVFPCLPFKATRKYSGMKLGYTLQRNKMVFRYIHVF
jgi:hypothetical protein